MVQLVKITRWKGTDIQTGTDPQWYGTLEGGDGTWPCFLSFEDFPQWSDDYSTYHAPVPQHVRYEAICWDELPDRVKAWDGLKEHVEWMTEQEEEPRVTHPQAARRESGREAPIWTFRRRR